MMLEECEDIRYTASCKYWLWDALKNVDEHMKQLKDKPDTGTSRLRFKVPTSSKPQGRK